MNALLEHADQILLSPQQLLAALADLERRTALAVLAIRRLEGAGAYEELGAASMKEWLRTNARMTDERAAEFVSIGRFLDRPKYAGELAASQAALVEHLASVDIAGGQVVIEHWKQCVDAVLDGGAPPAEQPCELTFARTLDNRLHGTIGLHDAAATEFEKAILNAITHHGLDETRTLAERRGDALFDVASFFNKNHDGAGTPRHLPSISLSADLSTVVTDDPQGVNNDTDRRVSPACVSAYLCDCRIHVILRNADGTPAMFGRATYTVSRVLFRQVAERDGGCRFPGCERTVRFTDAHHIHYWEHGGATDYDNLLLLCRRHHVYVHKRRVHVSLDSDGTAHFRWDHLLARDSVPRGAPPTRAPDTGSRSAENLLAG